MQDDSSSESASDLIDAKIAAIADWRGGVLGKLRKLILEADPRIFETVKWRKPTNPDGVPVWECNGILCTGDAFKDKVKITFAKGAMLNDPAHIFNAGLAGNAMRAIDLAEGQHLNEEAFKELIRAAVALNSLRREAKQKPALKR